MYPNQDAIFERLETTKQLGLLSDYLVSWSGRAGRLSAKVTVWGKDGTPEDVVQSYIARLLKGLVNDRRIFVAKASMRLLRVAPFSRCSGASHTIDAPKASATMRPVSGGKISHGTSSVVAKNSRSQCIR